MCLFSVYLLLFSVSHHSPPPVALVVWYWLNPTPSTSQFPVGPVGVAAGETRAYASWYGVLWGFVVFVRAITSTGHTGGAQVPV